MGRVRPRFYAEAKKHEETVSSCTKIYIGQIRKNVFMVVKQWNGLFKEMMLSPSPEVFMRYVDVALRDIV